MGVAPAEAEASSFTETPLLATSCRSDVCWSTKWVTLMCGREAAVAVVSSTSARAVRSKLPMRNWGFASTPMTCITPWRATTRDAYPLPSPTLTSVVVT